MAAKHCERDDLMAKFDELNIKTTTVEHPEVFTVETMMPYLTHIPGAHSKNLFMKDKKKKLWLLSARHNAEVKLADLAKKVGAPGGLRLADESILEEKLGVKQGCVTAYALINDKNNDVKFILDTDFVEGGHDLVFFHPLVNSATTGMSPTDFLSFLDAIDHKPTLVSFESSSENDTAS